MKYSKHQLPHGSTWIYSMQIEFGDEPKFIQVYPYHVYPSIDLIGHGGHIECTKEEFDQAFMQVSNRFNHEVFGKDESATRTETNEGNYTEINIKPKK